MRIAASSVAVAILLGACGSAPPTRVTRILGGQRLHGAFVSPYSYEWYVRGELAEARGDLEAAADAYMQARTGPEDDPLIIAKLADVLDRLGRRDEANEVIAEGLALDPESEAVWMARGAIAERRNWPRVAMDAYQRAARAAPRSEGPPLALFRLLRARGAEGRAEAVLERYIARAGATAPGALRARLSLALARGDAETAAETIESLVRIAPVSSEDVGYVVELALESGRPALALPLLERMPREAGLARLRIRALVASGRSEDIEGLLAATPAEQLGGPAHKAELWLAAGRVDRALELAEEAAALGADPDAWRIAGRAHLAMGEPAAAAELLAKVPRGADGYADARVALADALRSRGLRALANEVLADALSGANDDPGLLRRALADARAAQLDYEGALEALAGATSLEDTAARARILERSGRVDAAAATWASLASNERDLTEPIRSRADAEHHIAAGAIDEALVHLRSASDWAPEDVLARARLAEILLRAGRAAEAREIAAAALSLAVDPAVRVRLESVAERPARR